MHEPCAGSHVDLQRDNRHRSRQPATWRMRSRSRGRRGVSRRGPGTVNEAGWGPTWLLPPGMGYPSRGAGWSHLSLSLAVVRRIQDGACGDRGRIMREKHGDPGASLALVVVGCRGTAGPSLTWLAPRRVFAAKNHGIQGRGG